MRRVSKLLLVTATAVVVTSAGTVIAYANWSIPSKPVKVRVHAVDMPQGVQPSVSSSGADAVVTWSPQEIAPGATMQSYIVTRRSATDAAAVKVFAPVTAMTVTDTAVPTGRWYWTVTPKFAKWTGAESKKSATLKFTASAAPEPTALVANTAAAGSSPSGATSPPKPAGGSPVTSPPAPTGPSKSPAATEPEQEEVNPPPSASEESTPVDPAPSVTGSAEDDQQ